MKRLSAILNKKSYSEGSTILEQALKYLERKLSYPLLTLSFSNAS